MTWMQTYTGRKFTPLNPSPADIDIVDIAHALSMTCRFGGHCKQFYSVAQHSVLMAEKAAPQDKLRALLHDAAEAYIGDLIRPIKLHNDTFCQVEEIVELAIADALAMPFPITNAAVKDLDNRILADERDQVMSFTPCSFDDGWPNLPPLGVVIEEWPPHVAREKFLNAFQEYNHAPA